jgi:hypothetical protein
MKVLLCALLILIVASSAFAAPLSFTVNMSEAVNVGTGGGTPRIAVDVGGVTRYASYASGTGTSALTFTYTPQAGDLDLDGVTVSSPVDLNGGTIADLNGNAISNLTFTPPNTANVKVDYPSLSMDFAGGDYILSGTHYATLPSFLTAASGTFTRNSVGTYFDSSGNLQTAAAHTPRFDHDPVTHVAKGILIEENRTNGVRNNTMQGAVVGTLGAGGSLPATWQTTGSNGLSIAINGTGTENGISYIDIRFFGTTTTAGPRGVSFNTLTGCSATPSGNNRLSSYLKTQAGSQTNVSYWALIAQGRDAGGVPTGEYRASTPVFTALPLVQQRYVSSLVFTNAATNHYMPYLEFYPTGAGVAIDITVRIGMPQCEQGDFITSVIPTTNASVTRNGDILSLPSAGIFDSTQGTFRFEAQSNGWGNDGKDHPLFGFPNQAPGIGRFSGGAIQLHDGSAYRAAQLYTNASLIRYAITYGGIESKSSLNGGAVNVEGFDGDIDLGASSILGALSGGMKAWNGHIKNVKYHPPKITNTQLQLLTQ